MGWILMEITNGVIDGAKKLVAYGPEGIGKTTFASMFPQALFIDTEGSTKYINVSRLPEPKSWMQILNEANYVRDNPEVCKTLVVDTADWAERMCTDQVCSRMQITGIEDLGYGKGYTYLYEDFGKLLNILTEVNNKNINVVLTAHAVMRKFEQPDELGSYDRWELKLQKKIAAMVKEWADIVLFANYETTVVNVDNQGALKGKNKAQGGQRVMYTSHHPCWDAKNRHGLPEKLPFEFKQIAHLFPDNSVSVIAQPTPQVEQLQNNQPTPPPVQNQPIQQQQSASIPQAKPQQQSTTAPTQQSTQPPQSQQQAGPQQPTHIGNEFVVEVPAGTDAEKLQAMQAVQQLMEQRKITESEVCEVVALRGKFPAGMKIAEYPADFINGWIIGFFNSIVETVESDPNRLPF